MDHLKRAERIYGRMMWLYPQAYRERFGAEMRQVFRDLYRDRNGSVAEFWLRVATDSVAGSAMEHLETIRSGNMKIYLSNSADERVLVWGVGLMAPAGLFFLAAISGLVRNAQLPMLPATLPIMPILIAILPMVAIAINLLALAKRAAKREVPMFSIKFARRNFWTIALIFMAMGWLALLFGHDTAGCAVQNLPHLDWAGFQHCNSIH